MAKKLFVGVVYRTQSTKIYILADDRGSAAEGVEELASTVISTDWEDDDWDVQVTESSRPTYDSEPVWTGGPQGSMKPWSDLTPEDFA